MTNPFVYGEVVPAGGLRRSRGRARPARPRPAAPARRSSSSRRAATASRRWSGRRCAAPPGSGALTVEVTVSSYSSYVAFLEGYARALASAETRLDRAAIVAARDARPASGPRCASSPTSTGAASSRSSFPPVRTDRDVVAPRPARSSRCPAASPRRAGAAHGDRARRVPGDRRLQRRQRRARAARRRAAAAPGRLRLLRLGADADGADARHAAGRSTRPDRSCGCRRFPPIASPRSSSRRFKATGFKPAAGPRRRDRRARRQPALRRAAPRARGLGRREGRRRSGRRTSKTCTRR